MKSYRFRPVLFAAISLGILLGLFLPSAVWADETIPEAPEPATAPTGANATDPRSCIDPLKAAHIAAAIGSVLPIPGFKTAADMAEYGANLALKGCPPVLEPPQDIVKPPPPNCVVTLQIPLDATYNELNQLDDQFFQGLMDAVELSPAAQQEVQDLVASDYGRFEDETYGSYSNVYGMVLPLELSQWASGNWGDVGAPTIYHYNSDVFITLRQPGHRIDAQQVEFRPGVYTLFWQADTLISAFDWIPTFLIPNPFADNPAGQKAAKETSVEASKKTVQQAVKEAQKQTLSRFLRKKIQELVLNLLKKGGMKAGTLTLKLRQPYFVSGTPNATSYATQRLIVQDHTPPTIQGADVPVQVEAFLPGGASSAGQVQKLMATLVVSDDCDQQPSLTYSTPSFWPLQVDADGNPLPSSTIIWKASDNGAASPSGGVNTTAVTQTVTVVDTLPPILLAPPPVIMEADAPVEVPLGQPQVFDVADLRPSVAYDAPGTSPGAQWPIFSPGIHHVSWTATDRSQNQSQAKTQLVNIKAPGTNLPAVAIAQTGDQAIQAVADEPITITVRGQDGNNPPDPIWFTVEDQPENGFFIAPLYPYFIDDYRMTARYSPTIAQWEGEDFAWQVAQSPEAMRQYIIQLCEEDINRTDLPKDFVSWNGGSQKYMAVDDAGYTYIYDRSYRKCSPGGSTVAPYTDERISVWDQDGHYVGELDQSDRSYPLRDINFNVGQESILATSSDGSSTGSSVIKVMTTNPQNADEPVVEVHSYPLWNKINDIYVGSDNTRRGPEFKNAASAAWDTKHNVLYVAGEMNLTGMAAFQPAPCNNGGGDGPEDCLNLLGTPVYSSSIVQTTKWGDYPGIGADAMKLWNIQDLAVDSQGAVYVVANSTDPSTSGSFNFHRIYKFAPATVAEDGSMTPGDLSGWMGRCDSGPNCNYVDQHSIGFSCTDETCAVEGDLSGSGPGQFNRIAAIAIDPKDVLYVADSGNERVQRFNSDGLFAGEARSQSSCPGCTGFVLGDFGAPGNIAVNSSNFYILDVDTELVHVFEASVIHSIDESSAWVEYQSDSNYVGDDHFTFRATDGFRTAEGELIQSDPARVDLHVARNHRPPQATAGIAISTTEDMPASITLSGYDLDGALDTLSYRVTVSPRYGQLSGEPPNLTYTPDPDFYGEDEMTFVVNDGKDDSQPARIPIEVTPANDPPQVSIRTDPLHSGVGYPFTLDALVVDADYTDNHTIQVDWGDGAVESGGSIQQDGSLSGPIISEDSTITSTVLGYHTYTGAGTFPVQLCATDTSGVEACDTQSVQVTSMVDVRLRRQGPNVGSSDDRNVSYQLVVGVNPPQSGSVTASAIVVTETMASGASYVSASSNWGTCNAAGRSLHCNLSALGSGSSATIQVQARLDAGLAVGDTVETSAGVSQQQPDPIPDNNVVVSALTLLPEADFLVDTYEDDQDAAPGDGICATVDGACSLRAAIQEANASAGSQTVALGYGVYSLNLSSQEGVQAATADDSAANGDLDISDDLALVGLSPNRSVIHANGKSRVLDVANATVSLSNLMLTGGLPADEGAGGAVRNQGGSLRLERVSVTGNSALNGAGLANDGGTVTVVGSAITNNSVLDGGSGGGLLNQSGTLLLQNSTVSGNQAQTGGGLQALGGTVELQNVTLSGNAAANAGGGINGDGGSVRMINTIVAGNSAATGPNCAPGITSDGHNLLGDQQACTVVGDTTSDVAVVSADMDGLTLNAAETYSHPLLPSSQAIDQGTCLFATDQRGADRPYGDGCDIGAYELNAADVPGSHLYLPLVVTIQ